MSHVFAGLAGSIGDSQVDEMMTIGEEENKVLVGILKKARASSACSLASLDSLGLGSNAVEAPYQPDGRECALCAEKDSSTDPVTGRCRKW